MTVVPYRSYHNIDGQRTFAYKSALVVGVDENVGPGSILPSQFFAMMPEHMTGISLFATTCGLKWNRKIQSIIPGSDIRVLEDDDILPLLNINDRYRFEWRQDDPETFFQLDVAKLLKADGVSPVRIPGVLVAATLSKDYRTGHIVQSKQLQLPAREPPLNSAQLEERLSQDYQLVETLVDNVVKAYESCTTTEARP